MPRKSREKPQAQASVYAATHRRWRRTYVGAMTQDVDLRWATHRSELGRGERHTAQMRADFAADGAAGFDVRILEYVDDVEELGLREQYWARKLAADGVPLYHEPIPEHCLFCGAQLWLTPRANVRKRYCGYPYMCCDKAYNARRKAQQLAATMAEQTGSG